MLSRIALTTVLLLSSTPTLAPSDAGERRSDWSEPAPLAPRSLLLDADKAEDQIIAVGDRGHVLISSDQGASWKQVEVPARTMLTAVAASGSRVWAVGHDALVVHSMDGGRTWQRQHFDPERDAPLLDVWFADSQRGLAVGAYGMALETADGGGSWDEVTIHPEEAHLNSIAAAADGTLYVSAEDGGVFRSRDGGRSWEPRPTPYVGSLFGTLALSDAVLVFGLRGHVFRSENGGEAWVPIDTGTDATLLNGAQLDDGTVVIVGLSGTVLASRDGGRRFTVRNRPDRRGLAAALPLSTSEFLLFGEDGVQRVGNGFLGGAS